MGAGGAVLGAVGWGCRLLDPVSFICAGVRVWALGALFWAVGWGCRLLDRIRRWGRWAWGLLAAVLGRWGRVLGRWGRALRRLGRCPVVRNAFFPVKCTFNWSPSTAIGPP